MTRLRRFLVRMVLFLLAVAAVVALLFPQLERVFLHNAPLNSMILGAALIGIVFVFRMVLQLPPELAWIESYKRSRQPLARTTPRLLAPMATMLGRGHPGVVPSRTDVSGCAIAATRMLTGTSTSTVQLSSAADV